LTKAILLLSGGLDSTLAGKILLEVGVEVEAVNFTSPFCTCTPKSFGCPASRLAARQLGIPVRVFSCGREYIEVMKRPRFGRGKHMNACVDCRILFFSRARDYMLKRNADFVATGEVLDQRPMSQHRHTMELIERESGLTGRIVRPLSAQCLEPSLPEQTGLIDREKLQAIRCRGRKSQIQLAEDLGIGNYPCPAGGCLLTYEDFAEKFKELLDRQPDFGLKDAKLLRFGRHFRLPSGAKIIVGRNQEENGIIERMAAKGDALLLPYGNTPGPSVLVRRGDTDKDLRLAAQLMASYMKGGAPFQVQVKLGKSPQVLPTFTQIFPIERIEAEKWRIGSKEVS